MRQFVFLIIVMSVGLVLGCEQNANVRVGPPVLLSNPPETSLTSMGTLYTTPQKVREAVLAVANDLKMTVLQAPGSGIEGEAILGPPSGPSIRVQYKETEPGRVELAARRDTTSLDQQTDSLTRRIFDETRRRALSSDPAAPRP